MSSSVRKPVIVVLSAVAALVLPLVLGTTAIASATVYHQWTLSGVTFDDGGTLSGTMVLADDGTPYSFDLTTAGGDTGTYGAHHYTGTPSPLGGNGPANGWYLWTPDQIGQQYLNVLLPDTTSAQQGDSLPLATPDKSWECTNCSAIRYVNAGSIVAGGPVDISSPEISASVDPEFPDGNHGWYTGDPTVTFTVTDPDSAITNETDCDPQTIDADTTGVGINCQATSGGGTNSYEVFIRRDATAPTLAPSVLPKHVLLNGPISVAANADDATSGISTQKCSASTGAAGLAKATCRTVDLAGNRAKASVPYTVEYVMTPLTLSGKHRVNHDLSVATQLTDVDGHRIPNDEAAGLGCRVKLHVSGAQTGHACLTYDRSTHQFSTIVPLGDQAGDVTLRVSVSYPNSPVKTSKRDTVTIRA